MAKAEDMDKVAAIGNSKQLFRLIKETGIKYILVSETILERDWAIVLSRSRRLNRRVEHFRE